jgi:hypothetical protein
MTIFLLIVQESFPNWASNHAKGHGMAVEDLIALSAPSLWNKALEGIKHAFSHTWESCFAMQLTTGFDTYLYTFAEENLRIICPICERNFEGYTDIVTPYGFPGFVGTGSRLDFQDYWKRFARNKGYVCGYIGVNPVFEDQSYFDQKDVYQYNNIYILDLSLSFTQLFSNFSTNRKRQLKHYEDDLQKICLEKPLLVDFFLRNYHDFIRQRNASAIYDFSKETLSFLVNLENTILVGIKEDGKVVAVSVFTSTPYMGDFLFNISLLEGQQYSVALIWYGINRLKSMGIPYLNLGGGIQENDSLANFKSKFGSIMYPLKGLKQVYRPHIYKQLCMKINADPDDRIGFFPPYQKHGIP